MTAFSSADTMCHLSNTQFLKRSSPFFHATARTANRNGNLQNLALSQTYTTNSQFLWGKTACKKEELSLFPHNNNHVGRGCCHQQLDQSTSRTGDLLRYSRLCQQRAYLAHINCTATPRVWPDKSIGIPRNCFHSPTCL